MANTYMPRNIPVTRMTYADAVGGIRAMPRDGSQPLDRAPAPNTQGGVIKSVRSAPPPAASTQAPAPLPAAPQPIQQPRAAAGGYPSITPVRRSPITNDATLEEKIADNARGLHMDADGRPARWNVPTQIEGRDVSTTPAPGAGEVMPAVAAPAPVAAAAPIPEPPPPDATSETVSDIPSEAIAPSPVPTVAPAIPAPVPQVPVRPAAPASNEYGGAIAAARGAAQGIGMAASGYANAVKSIVRQVPRALNLVAGGTRRLAEGDAERAAMAARDAEAEHGLTGLNKTLPVQAQRAQSTARSESRRLGFSARNPSTVPHGTEFTPSFGANNYTRRVFGKAFD